MYQSILGWITSEEGLELCHFDLAVVEETQIIASGPHHLRIKYHISHQTVLTVLSARPTHIG